MDLGHLQQNSDPITERSLKMLHDRIVSQTDEEVKCTLEWCHEDVFRDGLCFDCFKAEQDMAWDDQDAERRAALEGVGYVFGDPVGEVMA